MSHSLALLGWGLFCTPCLADSKGSVASLLHSAMQLEGSGPALALALAPAPASAPALAAVGSDGWKHYIASSWNPNSYLDTSRLAYFSGARANHRIGIRGVYANRDFRRGEMVEMEPLFEVDREQLSRPLSDYVYYWGKSDGKQMLPLGKGGFLSHLNSPNLMFRFDSKFENLMLIANQDIKKGNELTINYRANPITKREDDKAMKLEADAKATWNPNTLVQKSSSVHGKGVFANHDFKVGELVEMDPLLLLTENATVVKDYTFNGKTPGEQVLSLGKGSLFNHADKPNLHFQFDRPYKNMLFIADRPIKKGEELFISYGKSYWRKRPHLEMQQNGKAAHPAATTQPESPSPAVTHVFECKLPNTHKSELGISVTDENVLDDITEAGTVSGTDKCMLHRGAMIVSINGRGVAGKWGGFKEELALALKGPNPELNLGFVPKHFLSLHPDMETFECTLTHNAGEDVGLVVSNDNVVKGITESGVLAKTQDCHVHVDDMIVSVNGMATNRVWGGYTAEVDQLLQKANNNGIGELRIGFVPKQFAGWQKTYKDIMDHTVVGNKRSK